MTSQAFDVVRESLDSHGSRIRSNSQGSFMAQCPHHEDGEASLHVTDKGDRVLLRCFAGCNNDDIVKDIGLELSSLFDGEPSRDRALPVRSYLYEDGLGRPWFWKDRYFPKTFICRLPGTEPGDRTGLKGRPPILYHYPQLVAGIKAGKRVWIVDGEKDVETLERLGEVATTTPNGAGADWLPQYTQAFRSAVEVIVVVDQDKPKADGTLGAGQRHAVDAVAGMRSIGVKVRRVAPAVGKDATDHIEGGYGLGDFVVDLTASVRPRGVTAAALQDMEFPDLVYCVADVLPAGLAVLAGAPKAGKSWIALDMGIGVSLGGRSMGELHCSQGSVLYLAREDSKRRIQQRVALLTRGELDKPDLRHLEIIAADEPWTGGEIGLAAMTEWAEEVGDPRLVVLDTLAKVEPVMDDRDRYRSEYALMTQYKAWADLHNCTVLMVHHLRKARDEEGDPFAEISGTRGITGAADTLLVLKKEKDNPRKGLLHLTGRDVAEQSIELMKFGPLWTAMYAAEGV